MTERVVGGGGDKNLFAVKGVDSSGAIISPCGSCKYLQLPRIHYTWRHDSFVFAQLGELSCNLGREQLCTRICTSADLAWEKTAQLYQKPRKYSEDKVGRKK